MIHRGGDVVTVAEPEFRYHRRIGNAAVRIATLMIVAWSAACATHVLDSGLRTLDEQIAEARDELVVLLADHDEAVFSADMIEGAIEALDTGFTVPAAGILTDVLMQRAQDDPMDTVRMAQTSKYIGALLLMRNAGMALESYELAAQLDPRDPVTWNTLSYLMRQTGDLDGALAANQMLAEIGHQTGNSALIAASYIEIGLVHLDRKEFEAAERFQFQAMEIYRKFGDDDGVAITYQNLAVIHLDQDQLDAAELMQRRALAIHEANGRMDGIAAANINLGNVLQKRGELEAARKMYETALHLFKEGSVRSGVAKAYTNLCKIDMRLGDFESAKFECEAARPILEDLGRVEQIEYIDLTLDRISRGP